MLRFRYRAYTPNGQMVSDLVSAPTETDAVRQLMAEGLTPFEIGVSEGGGASTGPAAGRRQPVRTLSQFCRNLAAMLGGGLPLDEALKLLAGDTGDRAGARLAEGLRQGVLAGQSLGEAMAALKSPPPDYVLGLIRAGEEGGSLVPVLGRLATALENQARLASAVRSALIYPIILLLTSLASVLLILLVVAPALEPVLTAAGEETPAAAAGLIALSQLVRENWTALTLTPLVILLAVLIWSRSAPGRQALAAAIFRIPVIGELVRDIEVARVLASLSALLENGMSLVPALEVASEGAGNPFVRLSTERVAGQVRTGEKLSGVFAADGFFPSLAAQLAAVGERSGDMARQMFHASTILEDRSRRQIETLTTIAGPVLTLVLGLLIGGIVLTLLNAIMSVNDLAVAG